MEKRNIIIVGSGPAGLTAAIYSARAGYEPLVFEGLEPGGQLITTTVIENFPGFPEGIDGPELMENMRQQAMRFGAELKPDFVNEVELTNRPFKVIYGDNQEIYAQCLIIASGASAKWLGLPSEKKFKGRGVSSCATCDGFFYRGKRVAVVGGGDTAIEEAIHLTKFATEVVVIHRRDELRASKFMQERAKNTERISWRLNTTVLDILGEETGGVTGISLKNITTGERTEMPIDGVFIAIGHHPNTEFIMGQLPLHDNGFIQAEDGFVITSIHGVFAAGDVVDAKFRQAITAAGMGCMAALEAQAFLDAHPA